MDGSCHILHKSGECPEKRRSAVACCNRCSVLACMYISAPGAQIGQNISAVALAGSQV